MAAVENHDSPPPTVVQRDSRQVPIALLASGHVSVMRDWPQRTALMVGGAAFSSNVVDVFGQRGFAPVVADPEVALDVAGQSGPFSFLLLSPLALGLDGGAKLARELRNFSPSARVVLLGRPDQFEPTALIEAMRAGASDVVDPDDVLVLDAMVAEQLRIAGLRRERVLAIGAHPDDVEIGCAGTLLDHRRRGDRISLLTLSRGAVGGNHLRRIEESSAVADTLGAQLLLGDLPDTKIDSGVETIRMIEDVVRNLDPTIVYVHSGHDNHQDHRAVHTAALSATRSVPQVFAYQSPSATNDFMPGKFVAIDDVVLGKVELLALFSSQSERSYLEPEFVIAVGRYWARHLAPRARYAEAFEVVRSLRPPQVTLPVANPDPVPADRVLTAVPPLQPPDRERRRS